MAARHTVLSPSSLDSFLQCPFQFFGRKTLRLRLRPPVPRDRLDARLQGNIMHSVLADPSCASLLGVEVLNQFSTRSAARLGCRGVIARRLCGWNCCATSKRF
jgi:hypothetical protein